MTPEQTLTEALAYPITDALRQKALTLATGGKGIIVNNEKEREALALLTAVDSLASEAQEVHLITDLPETASRLSVIAVSLPVSKSIVCITAETLILDFLKGTMRPMDFALIVNGEQTLIRDGNTPVILAHSPVGEERVSDKEITEADRTLLRGRDYEVQNDAIVVRDSESGELLPGRRFSGGLQAAIQQREGLPIENDGKPIAQITVGDFFRRYTRLSALTQTWHSNYTDSFGLTGD